MMSRKLLSLAAVTGLEGGCIAAILLLGGVWLRIEPSVCGEGADVAPSTDATAVVSNASASDGASVGAESNGARTLATLAESSADGARQPIASAADVEERALSPRASQGEHAGEAELYAAFMARASSEPGELERAARETLNGSSPRYAKVAALRAVWDSGSAEAAAIFADAIVAQPDRSDARSASVPRFALGWLARHAPRSEPARRVLEDAAWPRSLAIDADLRRVAAEGLAAAADEAELARISARLAGETDRAWTESVARALARNPNRRVADAVLWQLGLDPEDLRHTEQAEE
jgi:hypothetical protein